MTEKARNKHLKFVERHLQVLPAHHQGHDVNKMAILFYSFQSLSCLGVDVREQYADNIPWIKSHYVTFRDGEIAGFVGSLNMKIGKLVTVNLSNTLFSLLILTLFREYRYIHEEMDHQLLGNLVKKCQLPNGSFKSCLDYSGKAVSPVDGEDLRYCYMAVAILYLLGCRTTEEFNKYINVELLETYILDQRCPEGAFGQYGEAHAGYTSCALSALSLLGSIQKIPKSYIDKTLLWLSNRQVSSESVMKKQEDNNPFFDSDDHGGFQGRPNKFADTCYALWCLNSIQLLTPEWELYYDREAVEKYLIDVTQNNVIGGFSKNDADDPDLYHTCLGISSLTLMRSHLNGALCLPKEMAEGLLA
ncbi:protein geranylgeranyltransferase type I subunit CDC43 [Nakaseomyces bracarensis]|uniref:protein geranylgeranyltransferase type I subunit CDC43 n=1 Tax=Nakaseomyces bracarensis TaxID=273131 RepID=UPI0038710C7D